MTDKVKDKMPEVEPEIEVEDEMGDKKLTLTAKELQTLIDDGADKKIKEEKEAIELQKSDSFYEPVKHIFTGKKGREFIAFLMKNSVNAAHLKWVDPLDMNLISGDKWDMKQIWENIRERSLGRK